VSWYWNRMLCFWMFVYIMTTLCYVLVTIQISSNVSVHLLFSYLILAFHPTAQLLRLLWQYLLAFSNEVLGNISILISLFSEWHRLFYLLLCSSNIRCFEFGLRFHRSAQLLPTSSNQVSFYTRTDQEDQKPSLIFCCCACNRSAAVGVGILKFIFIFFVAMISLFFAILLP
jgi:hypothetical protein